MGLKTSFLIMIIRTNYKEIFKIDKDLLDDLDPEINKFLEFWKSSKESITVNTSGSTGNPKKINLKRKTLIQNLI